jgi:hypothetical protein
VEVKNFQSIAHEVIEIDGFSAVVGRSNIGKSAVVRAIKAALTGSSEDSYVRHGPLCLRIVKGSKTCKCSCTVHIVAPGLDLLWEKGDAVNRYVYNTVEHTVVGRGTPEFLADEFSLVKLGDEKELLQVSDQFRPIFILNRSGTVVADVLSDVAKLDQINVASRLAEKDRKDTAATRKVREKDVLDLRVSLAHYDGLDETVSQVGKAENLSREVDEAEERVEKLERLVETALGVARRIKSLEQVNAVVVPPIEALVQTGDKVLKLDAFKSALGDRTTAVDTLIGVESVEVPEFEECRTRGVSYEQLAHWADQLGTLQSFFERAKGIGTAIVPPLDALKTSFETYSRVGAWSDKILGAAKALLELKEALAQATTAETAVLAEFQQLGVCPTCNREYTVVHQHVGT